MFRLALRNTCHSLRRGPLARRYSSGLGGYSVQQVAEIEELRLRAVHLEHQATGAQHLHLACDDPNNFFGVSFGTPCRDSTGVAHILEHLALCGSRRYPCRDPFFNMLRRSLANFMNAMTGSDVTIYGFSTQNPKDFQNLLSVYLDAAFFPSLREIDFRQEGWRLEHQDVNDRQSPIVFKGVVFNEMKGLFGDASQYYARSLHNLLFPGTAYAHESGGDPLDIPGLTWGALRDFHATHYHPSNSRFVTYGNLPLEEHLSRIEEYVLGQFDRRPTESAVDSVQRWTQPRESTIFYKWDPMAAAPHKQTTISNSFVLSDVLDTKETFILSVLGTLLVDGPSAPFYRALLQSGIGPDYSPGTGFDSQLKESIFSVGLREIAEEDIGRVQGIINSTFDEVIERGFPERQVQGVLHNLELATKNRSANFGLSCCLGVNSVWRHGGDPVSALRINEHVQHLATQMANNPRFFQDKVAQYFKSNPHRLTLLMHPDKEWEQKEQQLERELLQDRLSALTPQDNEQIFQQGLELMEHQKETDPSCLPTLLLADVQHPPEEPPLRSLMAAGCEVQVCEQPTNGVVYFRALLDASRVPDHDLPLLPLFCNIIPQMGAGERDYLQLDEEVQLRTGGLGVRPHLAEHNEDPLLFTQEIKLSSYCLEKNTDHMFSLWKDIFNSLRLEDSERLTQLVRLCAAEVAQSIAHRGHMFSMRRSAASLSPCAQRKELTAGLEQVSFLKQLAEMPSHEQILERLRGLADLLFNRSSIRCSINATPEAMPSILNSLESFLQQVAPSGTNTSTPVKCEGWKSVAQKTHFVLPLPVNFLGQTIPTVPYAHTDFASLKVASRLISSKFLHGEIREKGGAYGGGASISKSGHFMFYSYRDPNVDRTLDSFRSGVGWLCEGHFSDRDVEEAKLEVLKEMDAPVSPGARGSLCFEERISAAMKQQTRTQVVQCTRHDLLTVTSRYLSNASSVGTALIGPANEDKSWTVITN